MFELRLVVRALRPVCREHNLASVCRLRRLGGGEPTMVAVFVLHASLGYRNDEIAGFLRKTAEEVAIFHRLIAVLLCEKDIVNESVRRCVRAADAAVSSEAERGDWVPL